MREDRLKNVRRRVIGQKRVKEETEGVNNINEAGAYYKIKRVEK
jgi:hypothetical protein